MSSIYRGIQIKKYRYQTRKISFIRVPFEIRNTELKIINDTSIVSGENIHHVISDYCQRFFKNTEFNLIVYSVHSEFKNIFRKGLCQRINLIMCNVSTSDSTIPISQTKQYFLDNEELICSNYFSNEIRALLIGRMPEEFIDTYLHSLRNGMMPRNITADRILLKNKLNMEYIDLHHFKIAEYVENLTKAEIITAINIIINNEINHSTSSNVFNLHKTEPRQQHALNLKKASNKITVDDGSNSNTSATINETFKFFEKNIELTSGNTYIMNFPKFKLLTIEILDVKFKELIRRNFILYFYIIETKLSMINCIVAVSELLYNDFQSLRIDKNLIQFKCIQPDNPNFIKHTDLIDCVLFDGNLQLKCWQSGNPVLLGYNVFSQETLTSPMKTFDLYAICCIDFINEIVKLDLAISIHMRIIVGMNKFKFYYVRFTCMTMYAGQILTELFPKYQQKICIKVDDTNNSLLDVLWSDRRCCTILYHTYFKWLQDSGDIDNERNKIVFRQNLSNYKYIEQTGNVSLEPKKTSDAMVKYQVNIMIFIYFNFVHLFVYI